MPFVPALIFAIFVACQAVLVAVGAHRLVLLWRSRHGRAAAGAAGPGAGCLSGGLSGDPHAFPPAALAGLPSVTVQLPIHNERYVVRRLMEAVAAMDYPRARLAVQVLDDSTDDTTGEARACAAALRARGCDVGVLHRAHRAGYKAGALEAGLEVARGELIAVFDADFVPPADFLRRAVRAFDDPRVGMAQARWGHLNEPYSLLTRVQAAFLDGHFLVEQRARSRSGACFNFNGTAGVWRREAVMDAGGWQHDTLTEDLDLSYRAQLRGWRFVYLEDLVADAELPVELNAFKSQQHRWARGSMQTARKLLPRLLASRETPARKFEACFHLLGNLAYPAALVPALLMLPLMWLPGRDFGAPPMQVALAYAFTTAAFVGFFAGALAARAGDAPRRWLCLPAMMVVGMGMSLNATRAVFCGLSRAARPGDEFRRTPKWSVRGRTRPGGGRRYRARLDRWALAELLLAVYFACSCAQAVDLGRYEAAPFLGLFAAGFAYVGGCSTLENLRSTLFRKRLDSPAEAVAA
ncbi:MAG: glycosyltransferase [Candidatus Eisenbacteria bacterium]|nr:glycosyltransferase [Candidatus Eisenbacteria bacterium]